MLSTMISLFCLIIFLIIYFVPIIVASYRDSRHFGSIVVITMFLGWTFVGWVIALAMACSDLVKNEISE